MFVVMKNNLNCDDHKIINEYDTDYYDVLDLDDCIVETVSGKELYSNVKTLGVHQFINITSVVHNNQEIVMLVCIFLTNDIFRSKINITDWVYADDTLKYKGDAVSVYFNQGALYYKVDNTAIKLATCKINVVDTVFVYLERMSGYDICILHYLLTTIVGVLYLYVIINNTGEVIGVGYKPGKDVMFPYTGNTKLYKFASKLSMLKPYKGWWNYLLRPRCS